MSEKDDSSFYQRIVLLIIDKLLIASIILIMGYFISLGLKKSEYDNQFEIEQWKNTLDKERELRKEEFLLIKDSIERNFILIRDEYEREYLNDRKEIERYYIEAREDLTRRDDQLHQSRLLEFKNQALFELENIKSEKSIDVFFTRKSIEKIAEVWENIYKLSISSEEVQQKIENWNKIRFNEKENVVLSELKLSNDIDSLNKLLIRKEENLDNSLTYLIFFLDPKAHFFVDSLMNEKKIIQTELDKLNADHLQLKEEINIIESSRQELVKKYYDFIYDIDVESLFFSIKETRRMVDQNLFWLGVKHHKIMTTYLDFYIKYVNKLPLVKDDKEKERLDLEFNKKRQDIYKVRDQMFQNNYKENGIK